MSRERLFLCLPSDLSPRMGSETKEELSKLIGHYPEGIRSRSPFYEGYHDAILYLEILIRLKNPKNYKSLLVGQDSYFVKERSERLDVTINTDIDRINLALLEQTARNKSGQLGSEYESGHSDAFYDYKNIEKALVSDNDPSLFPEQDNLPLRFLKESFWNLVQG